MKKLAFLGVAILAFFVMQSFRAKTETTSKNGPMNSEVFASEAGTDTVVPGAPVPPEIENPELLGINKEPWHTILMVYGNQAEALKAIRHASSYFKSLNGPWKLTG